MSSLKFFTHTCRKCKLTFRLLIKPDQSELLKIRCPDCSTRVWLDNRDGGLAQLKRKRLLSRPIREYELKPGVDYVDPEPPPPPPLELAGTLSPGHPVRITTEADRTPPNAPGNPSDNTSESTQPSVSGTTAAPPAPAGTARRPHRMARLKGAIDAAASRLYLIRYSATEFIAARFAQARNANASLLKTLRGAVHVASKLATRGASGARKTIAAAGELVFVTATARIGAGLHQLSVYGRSLGRGAARIRRLVQARKGDLGPAILRRLRESRLYPRVTFERFKDVVHSALDTGDQLLRGPDAGLLDGQSATEPGRSGILRRAGALSAKLRRVLWSDRIPRPLLAGAYISAPVFLLALYIGVSFAFPPLALPESIEVFEARLQPVQPNRILDREGGLLAELFSRKTSNIQLGSADSGFPDTLKHKLLFVEDESFYEHGGVRPLAILRAFFRNLAAGRYVEGGSTITQQVARLALRNRGRNLSRKFQEAVLCRELESRLTKDEILTAYINHVYMGHGAYGMQVAAAFFFNRPLIDLNFAEELMLVTVLPAPAEFSPLRNPARLEQRMDLLYNRMVREDFPRIPADRYRHQKNELFSGLQDQSPNQSVFASRTNHAPYVAEYIRLALRSMARAKVADQKRAGAVRAAGLFAAGEKNNRVEGAPNRRRSPRSNRTRGASELTAAHIAELFQTGVTIHTSIDPALQKAATRETPRYIGDINPRYPPYQIVDDKPVRRRGLRERLAREYEDARLGLQILGLTAPVSETPRLQAAAIGVAPKTGAVLFMQGGAGFRAGNQLNHAISMRRQTGSAIKPFVYSAAIESGRASPASILDDKPFPDDGPGPEEDPDWKPRNYKDDYHGKVSVRFALQKSLNIPTIQLAQRTGMSRLALQFQKFFFPTEAVFRKRFRRDLTVAIGSLEMSPLEMAAAYTAFGNNGVIRRPYLIEKIIARDGTVLFARGEGPGFDEFNLKIPEKRRVISGDVAHVMASLLRDSARKGGAGYWSRFTLGKTGTSNHYRDAWFVGVLPEVSAAVWVGYDQPANSMGRATGSAVAGPLWARIIGSGMGNRSPGEFHFDPHGVYHTVCVKSGGRPTAQCPRTKKEIFPRAHPPGKCWKHGD
ncbi:MAG: transglycosylase domain-containing protein [Leptospirales bacterium]|jgi:penicillin-binding protein 1A